MSKRFLEPDPQKPPYFSSVSSHAAKTSAANQLMYWEDLRNKINGLIRVLNAYNIDSIVKAMFQINLVRGRGLLANSVVEAQMASPDTSHVFAAIVAIINSKFPQNGKLVVKRLILIFREGYYLNDKMMYLNSVRFIAHLINQQVVNYLLALDVLKLLLDNPTDDSLEVSTAFIKECGQRLSKVSPRGINSIFERLKSILHEGRLDVRVQNMLVGMFTIREDGWRNYPAILLKLDLVPKADQKSHKILMDDALSGEENLNHFEEDPFFDENERHYEVHKKEIREGELKKIFQLKKLRNIVKNKIQSSVDASICAPKFLDMKMKSRQIYELSILIVERCTQLHHYDNLYGLLIKKLCQSDKKYDRAFHEIFTDEYEKIHRRETKNLKKLAYLFSKLLWMDAISWQVLGIIKLTRKRTSSAGRIFIMYLFQDLSENFGFLKLKERLRDPGLFPHLEGLSKPKSANKFFGEIGLGGLMNDVETPEGETSSNSSDDSFS